MEKGFKNISVRAEDEFVKRLDDWRREQKDIPSRAEAVRRLVEMGLDAKANAQK